MSLALSASSGADGGRDHHALGPLQQLDAEHVLQLLDRGAEGRLADEAIARGGAEMATLDNRDEETELAKGGERRAHDATIIEKHDK